MHTPQRKLYMWIEMIMDKQGSPALMKNSGKGGSSKRVETGTNPKPFSWLHRKSSQFLLPRISLLLWLCFFHLSFPKTGTCSYPILYSLLSMEGKDCGNCLSFYTLFNTYSVLMENSEYYPSNIAWAIWLGFVIVPWETVNEWKEE